MTIPRLNELIEYWSQFPPAHLLLAAQAGVKTKHELWADVLDEDTRDDSLDRFMAFAQKIKAPIRMIPRVDRGS